MMCIHYLRIASNDLFPCGFGGLRAGANVAEMFVSAVRVSVRVSIRAGLLCVRRYFRLY